MSSPSSTTESYSPQRTRKTSSPRPGGSTTSSPVVLLTRTKTRKRRVSRRPSVEVTASTSRPRATRGRGRGRGAHIDTTQTIRNMLIERKARLKEQVEKIPAERLRDMFVAMIEGHPALMFSIMEAEKYQPDGHHPPPGPDQPSWCCCGKCRNMPTDIEKLCCGYGNCLSLVPEMQYLILDSMVLQLARVMRRDILVFDDEEDEVKANRHAAYRQFIMWRHGRLGAGERRVIPSCCVWAVRDRYPDLFGQYTGFIPSRFN